MGRYPKEKAFKQELNLTAAWRQLRDDLGAATVTTWLPLPWFGKSAYLQIFKIWVSCTVEYVYMLRIFWVNQESRGGLVPEIQHWQKRVSARNCQSLSGKSAYLQYAWIRLIPADLDHSKCNICTLISSCLTQSEFIVFISLPQDAYRCNKW